MRTRIERHRRDRDARWRVVEEPLALAEALRREARKDTAILVDCLTFWLANLIFAARDVPAEMDTLLAALGACEGPAVFVSNEVGSGIVPDNATRGQPTVTGTYVLMEGATGRPLAAIDGPRLTFLRTLVARHAELTGSARAGGLLENWKEQATKFWRIAPKAEVARIEGGHEGSVEAKA